MDPVAIATALISAQVGQMQLAVAARLARMEAEQGAAVAQLLDAARTNFDRLANVAAGIGTGVDLSI